MVASGDIAAFLATLSDAEADALRADWSLWARPDQLPPQRAWRTWLAMAGRGWGKTRVIAEWARMRALAGKTRGAIVGRTHDDARHTIVEGESGILACAAFGEVVWQPGNKRLYWPATGSVVYLFSADKPDRLRGPQFHWAIGDEVATWRDVDGYHAADMLEMGVRLGTAPQIVYATTPRPTARIRELTADPDTVVTRGSTYDNAANLAPAFLTAVRKRYEGTRLGDQELMGLVLDKVEGALWSMDLIVAHRVDVAPSLAKVVVAVDPAMTSGPDADETGIVAVGRGHDGHGYVIADRSGRYGVTEWPRIAADLAAELGAPCLHVEDNTLKDAMGPVMRAAGVTMPVRAITAYKSKEMRATPIVMLYEQGRMHHVGELLELEAEQTSWVPTRGKSPNRVDALVHAATELRLIQPLPDTAAAPRPRRIAPPRTI